MKQSQKFRTNDELLQWFRENHSTSPGIWIRFNYTETPSSVTPDDALRIALRFGWVDDRIKKINEESYRKKFIPRREGSLWTDAQRTAILELTENGEMEKAGLDVVTRAKLDGSWNTTPASPVTDIMLETFTAVLRPYDQAFSNYLRLPPASQRTYAHNYCSAKRPETRARRLATIVEKLRTEPRAQSSSAHSTKQK